MDPLRRRTDIQRAFQEGARAYSPGAVLHARRREEGPAGPRLGVIASKRVGGAVQRNRARRRLREATRVLLGKSAARWDVLLVARPEVLTTGYAERLAALRTMLRQAGVLEEPPCE